MVRESKFKKGMKVKSVLNKHEEYEIVEVLRNDLVVRAESCNEKYRCRKGMFEVL
jgi:hypothetical protein